MPPRPMDASMINWSHTANIRTAWRHVERRSRDFNASIVIADDELAGRSASARIRHSIRRTGGTAAARGAAATVRSGQRPRPSPPPAGPAGRSVQVMIAGSAAGVGEGGARDPLLLRRSRASSELWGIACSWSAGGDRASWMVSRPMPDCLAAAERRGPDRHGSSWSRRARPGCRGRSDSAIAVAAPDAGAEAVERVVGDLERFLFGLERGDRDDRPKISSWKMRILLLPSKTVGFARSNRPRSRRQAPSAAVSTSRAFLPPMSM